VDWTPRLRQQKCIRRGLEGEALFWATELDLAGYGAYVWKRLQARKLAVLLHRLWVSGEVYEALRNRNQEAMPAAA
jgi:hypothetical protein